MKVRAYREEHEYRRTAIARFPWGDSAVFELVVRSAAGETRVLGWFVE